MRHPRFVVPLATLVVGALVLVGLARPVTAAPPTDDPGLAARYGARWLATQLDPGGYVADGNGDPSPGQTAGVALALAAARVPELAEPLGWLRDNVDAYVAPEGTDSAGNLAYLVILALAAGEDPTAFGGTDLVSRLEGTFGAFEPGLYGAADPTFDGAFRQSLALLALTGAGRTPPAAAVTWLVDQQCGTESPPSTVGGWEAYRSDVATPCNEPDPVNYVGADTNSTAMAVQASATLGLTLDEDPLAFLDRAQGDDGGFPFVAGGDVDPNSTALVVQALVATDQDLGVAPWADGGANPLASLLSWQLGCDAPVADQGALASPFSDGSPDLFATQQGVWGLARTPFPLPPADPLTPAPTPCEPIPGPSTPDPSTPGTAPADARTGSTPTSGAPTATAVTPRFAG